MATPQFPLARPGLAALLALFSYPAAAIALSDHWTLDGAVRARMDIASDRDIHETSLDTLMLGMHYDDGRWIGAVRHRWYGGDYPFHYVGFGHVRFFEYAWAGIKLDDQQQLRIGLDRVPFGLQPLFSSTFYETLGNVVGLEDVNMLGIGWQRASNGWDVRAGAYVRPAWPGSGTSRGSTYSIVVTPADPGVAGGQQNQERTALAMRVARALPVANGQSEVGLSLYHSLLQDQLSSHSGQRTAIGAHYQRRQAGWELRALLARQVMDPPGGGQVVSFGGYDGTFNVASRGTLASLDLSRTFDGPWLGERVRTLRPYVNYSRFEKSAAGFIASERFIVGASVSVSQLFIALELLNGRNDPYIGGSSYTQSLAAGGTDVWKRQLYLNVGWYF